MHGEDKDQVSASGLSPHTPGGLAAALWLAEDLSGHGAQITRRVMEGGQQGREA